jgi:hypothetical protein
MKCCNQTAPTAFNVTFSTTVGNFSIHIERQWSPWGVDRYVNDLRFETHIFTSLMGTTAASTTWRSSIILMTQLSQEMRPVSSVLCHSLWCNSASQGCQRFRGYVSADSGVPRPLSLIDTLLLFAGVGKFGHPQ